MYSYQGWLTTGGMILYVIALAVWSAGADRQLNKDIPEARRGHAKICDEKFAAVSSLHTACLQNPRRSHEGMSKETKDVVLGIHNYYREKVGQGDGQYPAADMQIMMWDHELADLAQKWASNCIYSHDLHKNRVIPGRFYVGQNIAWTSLYDWKFTLEAWHEEYKHFHYGYGPTISGGVVGHYTQMVWASSTKLGCGYAFCNGTRHFYVCNYGPIANVEQPNDLNAKYRPYKKGPSSLSSCPYNRRDGLCDCQGKVCLNGGTIDVSTCTCRCPNRPWIDRHNDCALKCSAARDAVMCKTNRGGVWDTDYCMKYINVPYEYCPIMCNWCPVKARKYSAITHRPPLNNPHRKVKTKTKTFGENELPLGDQPHKAGLAANSTSTTTTTTTTTTPTTIMTISTTTLLVASTTTTSSTTTNRPNDVAAPTRPPLCLKAETPQCGQPHPQGYYPPRFCSNNLVRLTCPAMCGSCSVTECVDYEGHRFQLGSSWLTVYGRVVCTWSGVKFTSGCVKSPSSPDGMFVPIGGKGIFRRKDFLFTCTCRRVGGKKKFSCTRKWMSRGRQNYG